MHSELICETCGIWIRWQSTTVDGHVYCCLGCAQGGPCECDYDNLPRRDKVHAMVRQEAETQDMVETA